MNNMLRRLFLGISLAMSIYLMAGEAITSYHNPVVDYSLPDPSIIQGEDGYFICMRQRIYVISQSIGLKISWIGNLLVLSLQPILVRLLSQRVDCGHRI